MKKLSSETNQLIKDTLLRLILEKGVENITVNSLTKEAKINRSTFYLHYDNLNTLIKEIEDELLESVLRISATQFYDEKMSKSVWLQYSLKQPLSKIMEDLPWYRVLLSTKGDPAFANKMYLSIKAYNAMLLRRMNMNISEFYLDQWSSGSFGMFLHWMRTDSTSSMLDFIDFLYIPKYICS